MYKKERRIDDLIGDTYIKDAYRRGFKNYKIIKDWNLIFNSLNEGIDSKCFKPIKQIEDTLIVGTSDMNFYAKFDFIKSKLLTAINQYFGSDFIRNIKIKLI